VTTDETRHLVADALMQIVPDADVDALAGDESLRDALELDSLDFLSFVEQLSATSGLRLDESDYPALATLDGCVELLTRRLAAVG
jgi:acyl carrier protein